MKILKNQQGFSLVEILISTAVFSVVIIGYLQLRGLIFKQEKVVDDRMSQIKILTTIKDEILKDDLYIFPLDLGANVFSNDALFDDRTKAGFRCYDHEAALKNVDPSDLSLNLAEECAFRVDFYKARVRVPGKARSPLSQYHIRVRFFIGSGNERREEQILLRPFVTNVQYY